jgi:hypothetical protein
MIDEADPNVTDRELRKKLEDDDYKPSSGGMRFGPGHVNPLVRGAFRVARTAADKARAVLGRGK